MVCPKSLYYNDSDCDNSDYDGTYDYLDNIYNAVDRSVIRGNILLVMAGTQLILLFGLVLKLIYEKIKFKKPEKKVGMIFKESPMI